MADRIKLARSIRRKRRVRAKVSGTAARPRVSARTSLSGMYVQIIDDAARKTLVALRDTSAGGAGTKVEKARALGAALAERAKALGITTVVFDRGAKQYHGRVAALAEGLRAGGLTF